VRGNRAIIGVMSQRVAPTIQSVDRAVAILKALSSGSRKLGVSELADQLGLAKGTAHGLLRTLQMHGLVEQDAETAKYQLGPALLELSTGYLDLNELRSRALAWSELLATRSGEAVRVAAPHGDSVLVVHHVFRPDSSLRALEVGAVMPLHGSALGKAVLAHMEEPARDRLVHGDLAKLTAQTITTPRVLERELAEINDRGYALEREEAIVGEAGIAAPIFGRDGVVIGAIGIAGPCDRVLGATVRLTTTRDKNAAYVLQASRAISRDLGGGRGPAPAPADPA
jgi:DNA-binding IclR family transcriptional regulator